MKRIVTLKGEVNAGKIFQAAIGFQKWCYPTEFTVRGRNRVTGKIDTLVIRLPNTKIPRRVHLIQYDPAWWTKIRDAGKTKKGGKRSRQTR